jgi:hypothetical protein
MKSGVLNCYVLWWSRASVFYSGSARVESWSVYRLSYGFSHSWSSQIPGCILRLGHCLFPSTFLIRLSHAMRSIWSAWQMADGSCRYEAVITYLCFGRHCSTADCTLFLCGYVIYTDRSVKHWFSRFTKHDLAKVH